MKRFPIFCIQHRLLSEIGFKYKYFLKELGMEKSKELKETQATIKVLR